MRGREFGQSGNAFGVPRATATGATATGSTATGVMARHAVRLLTTGLICFLFCAFLFCSALRAEAEDKSSARALTTYAEAASYQNNDQYDLAAEEWEKFLKSFPQDPLFGKAQYYAGICRQQLKEFGPAAAHFRAVLKQRQGANSALAEDAYLNLGWSEYSAGVLGEKASYAKAEATFNKLLGEFPRGKYVDQALFYLGESRYAQQKPPAAILAYRRLVNEHKKSALYCDALYALGVTHEELQQYDKAGVVYDQFLETCGQSELAIEVRMRKAETVLQAGQLMQAAQLFAAVASLQDFEDADHAWFRQAYCAAKLERFAEAGKLYAQLTERFPESAYRDDATMAAGRAYYRGRQFGLATTWFERSVAAAKQDAIEAAHWLCRIHLEGDQPEQALALADRVLASGGTGTYLANLKLDRADALYELPHRREEAVQAYVKLARNEHPDHELASQALYNAAFGALELKQYKNAVRYSAQFLATHEKDRLTPDVMYVAAESYLQLDRYDEAAKIYRELVTRYAGHPENDKWQLRFGWTLYLNKQYDTAAGWLGDAVARIESADHLAEAHYLIGLSQFRQTQYAAAQQSLAASLSANRGWRQADETLLYQSRAQRKLNLLDEARDTVRRLIEEFPRSGLLDQAYYRLGEYNYAAQQFDQASEAYQTLLARWPDSNNASYALHGNGWSLLKGREFARGAESFATLVKKYPDHELALDARFARAMCLRQAKQPRQALEELGAYLKLDLSAEQRLDALYERGLCHAALESFADAASSFQELLEQGDSYKNQANALYELGWAYQRLDRTADAVAAFAQLARRHGSHTLAAEAYFHVAEDHYDQRRFAKAIPFYKQAVQRSANDQDSSELAEQACHKLAWSYYGLEQFELATQHFARQLQQHPDGALRADARFMQGESLFKLEDYRQAWPLFAAARDSMPVSPQMQVMVLLHGGQCAAQLERWQDSLQMLLPIPDRYPDTPQLAEALYERGWARQNLRQLDEALRDYERAASISRGEVGARARFMIGEVQFDRKQYAEAVNSFRRVMYGFGGETASPDVKQWQATAGYEAGRCVEVQIKDANSPKQRAKAIEDAKRFFRFVVEKHVGHRLAEKARQRLTELSKLSRDQELSRDQGSVREQGRGIRDQ